MARKAKCRACGSSLDTTTAFKLIEHNTNDKQKTSYYCSREECLDDCAKKEKAKEDKDKAYELICEIIGREKIINTVLWKEWKVWNTVATDDIIAQYLTDNKAYLMNVISRLDDVEFNRIRYMSAILKNSLGDFKPKVVAAQIEKPKVKVDESFYGTVPTTQNKRRSLADLEDEF